MISFSLQIEEPDLPIFTGFLSTYDAGDIVPLAYFVVHSSPTAYRLNFTVTYPTQYFYVDSNDTDALRLFVNGDLQPNSSTVDPDSGIIVFNTNMLNPREFFVVIVSLTATNSVKNANNYAILHTLDWHNLPYGLEGGRFYNTTGERTVTIKTTQLLMIYTTSDENTPGDMVQVQEQISINVSITLPEVRITNVFTNLPIHCLNLPH